MPLANILEALADPALCISATRAVVLANAEAVQLLGGDPAGRDLAFSVRHPAVLDAVAAVLAGDGNADVRMELKGPVQRSFDVHVSPLNLPELSGLGVLALFREVTRTVETERMRVDFISNVSHELRSPLSSLMGFIETLQGPAAGDEEARERFLAIMQAEAERMRRLIDDLLTLSAIETDEFIPPDRPVDIGLIVRRVIDSLSMKAEGRGMEIAVSGLRDLPPVPGDADQLTQTIVNLLDNAIKYGREKSTVRIMASVVDRMPDLGGPAVWITVEDEGEGIAPEHLPRLTERFYRVDKGRSRAMGGTGLGLAIVKHIVNRHRGRLIISSRVGEGSIFAVYLPTA